jgi:hypothetical protein
MSFVWFPQQRHSGNTFSLHTEVPISDLCPGTGWSDGAPPPQCLKTNTLLVLYICHSDIEVFALLGLYAA